MFERMLHEVHQLIQALQEVLHLLERIAELQGVIEGALKLTGG